MTKSLKVLPNKVFRFFQPTLNSGEWPETLDNRVLKVGKTYRTKDQRAALTA
ncbi:hypothetical protein O53_1138 [Microcystis aeruginosa TAIHU98]|uniref:Uncharacterized protein n=1 Tax=Microcystis aeruginosa TAIHU98 TaxID=1134457 RepID=L7ECF4_MICAE|nr:hypothetical protein O53_1138 [Microcystis aeruginosa TAIHU98]